MLRRHPLEALALLASLLSAACGGGESADLEATTEDVAASAEDTETMVATEAETRAFDAPADSVLTEEQVDAYLKTSLLQFDYMRAEAEGLHARAQEIQTRDEKGGGALSDLRNMAAGMSLVADFGNIVGGSFVRSARTQGYNPAEMEWVRERMVEVSGYLMAKPMMEYGAQAARQMREQAEAMRVQLAAGQAMGFSAADIDEMIRNAEQMEAEALAGASVQGSALRNMEVLRQAKPAVSDPMWTTIGFAAGGMGLMAISGLGDPNDTEAQAKLDEFRRVYTDALENRVSPGLENAEVPPGP